MGILINKYNRCESAPIGKNGAHENCVSKEVGTYIKHTRLILFKQAI